jgi:hypothetical protein
MSKEKSLLPVTLSALFSTLLSCVLGLLVTSKFSIWNHLGTGERFWVIFAAVYAVVLTVSCWIYGAWESRVAGITHAVLMLGVAGLALYGVLSGLRASPGRDDAAVGVVAAANLVFVIIGALAAICFVAIIHRIFSRKESPESPR